MTKDRAFKSATFIVFLLYTCTAGALDTFFVKDIIRGLFSVTIEKPVLHTHESKGSESNQAPQKISVLVWNIKKGELIKNKLLPFSLKAYDFVLLQENIWKWSLKNLPYRGHHYFLPTFSIDGEKTGISTITRYHPIKAEGLHSNYYEPFIESPKSFMVLEFKNIAIINVHALNFVRFAQWHHEIKRVSKKANELIKKKIAVVIGGDFNTWDEDRMNALKSEFSKIGLQEVVFKKDLRTKTLGLPLDSVFSHGMRLRDSNVFPVEQFSDHNAMEVVLELAP